uniref:Uncharacterized protein n=1 Tax=Salmo trutta TaxID=8032 RepID=A0A674E5K4_SALTR
MQALQVLSLTLLSVLAANAQTFRPGKCPQPPVQANFDAARYLGNSDSVMSALLNKLLLKNVPVNYINKRAGLSRPVESLKRSGYPFTFLPYSPYWIISTDYENSALVYSCTDVLRLFHMDIAWILGRTPREIFTSSNIDVSRMVTSRQQGCDKTL